MSNYTAYGKHIKAWITGVAFEEEAFLQVSRVSKLPFIYKHVAVMPDVHWGIGATVGSVIATKGAVIPAAVGVDIGCGMIAQKLNLTANALPDNLSALRAEIEKNVPVGRTNNGQKGDRGAWHNAPKDVSNAWKDLSDGYNQICVRDKGATHNHALNQLGTLGSGNHFIEICLDEADMVWIVLHSGSRGPGNKIGTYFIEQAKRLMETYCVSLEDKNLSYLPKETEAFDRYWFALNWAQTYAFKNRQIMMNRVINSITKCLDYNEFSIAEEAINCHHNYASLENHFGENVYITRKGAVRAREKDLGIIPGAMGKATFIVRGKGNPESFQSCSHGAGRIMSRRKAKDTISLEDHIKATEGLECKKDESVLDESPAAYKDVESVMAAQSDLVDIVHKLRAVVCVKG